MNDGGKMLCFHVLLCEKIGRKIVILKNGMYEVNLFAIDPLLAASKYCGSGLKIDLVVVVIMVVVILVLVKFIRFCQGLKRINIFYPMEKYFGVYENWISSIEIYSCISKSIKVLGKI